MAEKMRAINLIDYDSNIEEKGIDFLARLDSIYIASQIKNMEQVLFFKNKSVDLVIDLKDPKETDEKDQNLFEEQGLDYNNLIIKNVGDIDNDLLHKLDSLLKKSKGKVLIYCASGNRVASLLALYLVKIYGHPKKRAYEVAEKIGMRSEACCLQVKEKLAL